MTYEDPMCVMSKPPKRDVCVILPSRGVGPSIIGFLLYLAGLGFIVEVFCSKMNVLPSILAGQFNRVQALGRVRVNRILPGISHGGPLNVAVAEFLYGVVLWFKLVVRRRIQSPTYISAAVPTAFFLLCSHYNPRVVYEDGGPLPDHLFPKLLSTVSSIMRKLIMIRANGVVLAGSDHFANRMIELFHIDTKRVLIQPECVLTDLLVTGEAGMNSSIAKGDKIVLSVGDISPRKNQLTLLKAVPMILSEIHETRFILVGRAYDSQYYDELLRFISSHHLNSVQIQGVMCYDSLLALYSRCDVLVQMSTSEGMSRVILEGMSLGKPIVCSAIPENIECAKNGSELCFVPPFDYASLAKAVVSLLRNKSRSKELGDSARLTALRWYDCRTAFGIKYKFLMTSWSGQ